MGLKGDPKIIDKVAFPTPDQKIAQYSLVEFPNKELAVIERKIGIKGALNGEVEKEVVFERIINYGQENVVDLFNKIKQKSLNEIGVNQSIKKVSLNNGEVFKGVVQNVVPGDQSKAVSILVRSDNRQFVLKTTNESVIKQLKIGQSLTVQKTKQGLKVSLVKGLKL